MAAGVLRKPLVHEEVLETGRSVARRLGKLLTALVREIDSSLGGCAVNRFFRACVPLFFAAAAALGAPGPRKEPRARKCDLTVLGGTVVTVDSEDRVHAPGGIAIDGGRILAVGPSAEIRSRFAGREEVSAAGEIVLPGLVNTHTHAAMTLLRGHRATTCSLTDWLNRSHLSGRSEERLARVRAATERSSPASR